MRGSKFHLLNAALLLAISLSIASAVFSGEASNASLAPCERGGGSAAAGSVVNDFLRGPECAQYVAAYRAAVRNGRPLLVLIGAEACIPCRKAHQFLPALRARGECVEIDVRVHRPLVESLRAAGTVPRLLVWRLTGRTWHCQTLVGLEAIRRYAESKDGGS
jgi:hypothetical protein